MGCDIHEWVEVRDPSANDVGPWKLSSYDPELFRNYDMFAILANVRNGHGFAGVKTGEGFIPISMPRGVPEDASDEYKHQVEEWGVDGHSHSWLTLREIREFDWNQTTEKQGWVDASEYQTFKREGRPRSWSGGVGGGSVKHVTNEQMDEIVAKGGEPGFSYYTLVKWTIKYRDYCGYLLDEVLPEMAKLGEPDDVRLVFFFDN
jgi:hypothetical protein